MSCPFSGKTFTFTQPDGTPLQVRGWGDQHYAVFETLDGYTVTRDPVTGYYHYAALTEDGEDLLPVGARPEMVGAAALGLAPRVRINREAAKARALENSRLPVGRSRWEARREEKKHVVRSVLAANGVLPAPPQRETVGDYVGLCLLVEFPDVPATIPREEVEAFCNKQGYNGSGNNGSVYDYFNEVSAGKLRYKNIVAPYYRAKHPRSYYTNPHIKQPKRALELIKEALDFHKAQGFDFSGLTADNQSYVYAVNVFYAGPVVNNWAEGLWPHSHHLLTPYALAPGKNAYDYQITNMDAELTLGTFCHENGHMICDFPDLYDYGYESRGVGVYCLMCAGGNANEKNPGQIGAYLKYKAGWATIVTPLTNGLNATARAGKNEFFKLSNSVSEYYLIENRQRSGRDSVLPASGLAIWHIDELGDNSNEQMMPGSHYECTLVQADGLNDLETNQNNGDSGDFFFAGGKAEFNGTTNPSSKWWSGTASGLKISQISAPGSAMTFQVAI